MAPGKSKSQGKRNKIKSKTNTQKNGLSSSKNLRAKEWMNKKDGSNAKKQSKNIPEWLYSSVYKHTKPSRSSTKYFNRYDRFQPKDTDVKSTSSEGSEECDCTHSEYNEKCRVLKRSTSSTNSLVVKYIQSGMNHVASFIVESAIRFGEKHGVVVPDKNSPNVYEINLPENRFDEKYRKIRFSIPSKKSDFNNQRMWRHQLKNSIDAAQKSVSPINVEQDIEKCSSSFGSSADSLEEILPLLEKLKEDKRLVTSDLDINELARENESIKYLQEKNGVRKRYRRRYKSTDVISDVISDVNSEDREYDETNKGPWKKIKRDSLELSRRRLRTATCLRKRRSASSTVS